MKPCLYPEITSHLCHTQPHGALITSQALQTKGKFMPHLVCDNLIIRILHNISDFCPLIPLAHLIQWCSFKANFSCPFSMRRQNGFQMTHQCRFSASALSAQCNIFSFFYLEINLIQCLFFDSRIRKGQIFDFKMYHVISSPICIMEGRNKNNA